MTLVLLLLALVVPAKAPSASKDPGFPATPTREAVVAAMGAVAPLVQQCGGGRERGLAQVRMVFRGDSGRVSQTTWVPEPSDPFSPPTQSCILGAARNARVPPFLHETFSVSYPFRLN